MWMRGCVDVWTYGIIIISCILNKINFHNLQSTAFKTQKEINIRDSNVVPHRSTNLTRTCLTSLSRREAVLSCWYGRSRHELSLAVSYSINKLKCDVFLVAEGERTEQIALVISPRNEAEDILITTV